jgi:two-component system, NtrC family, response regulator AtoC
MLSPRVESAAQVLIVDDEPAMLRYLRTLVESEGYGVETAGSGFDALQRIHQGSKPDLILLDMLMPGLDGLQTLQQIRQLDPALKVLMLSCVTDSREVVQAIRLGATDYIAKPFGRDDLKGVLRAVLGNPCQRCGDEVIEDLGNGAFFLAASPVMHRLRAQAVLVAKVDIPVLLLGETGTGKEVFAQLIHRASPRAVGPFLKVNCAAVPADLLESELFGYEPGAFTGATQMKPGKFELCNKGTILLDEIGEMTPALQAKLLHVLQDQQFSRLGGRSVIRADVRVVAATNIDVGQAIANKTLREDHYYRLNGFTLRLPPLRERKADITLFLRHFMRSLAERCACPALPIPQAALDACMNYPWPGNVRELENFLKRCLVLQEFSSPGPQHGQNDHDRARPGASADHAPKGLKSLARSARRESESQAIRRVLEETNWNRKQAAIRLKISYKALLYKIREYQIEQLMTSIA